MSAASFTPMLFILKFAFVLISLLVGSVVARNGCRQCEGELSIRFKEYMTHEETEKYILTSLNSCATNNEFQITGYRNPFENCNMESNPLRCQLFTFNIKAWRYCNNGGTVSWSKNKVCIFGSNICAIAVDLNMKCTRSVECHGTCDGLLC